MKIIQFEIGPNDNTYQGLLIGLGDNGTMYVESCTPEGKRCWLEIIENEDEEQSE